MGRKSFKLPDDISELANAAVARGKFRNVEDVLRAGVRAVVGPLPDSDPLTDDERAATEKLLLDRLHDGQDLRPFGPAEQKEFFDAVRDRLRTPATKS